MVMNKATVILAALVVALSILLGVSLKSGFEKSAKIAQLQDTIKGYVKASEKANDKINQGRKEAENEECYNKRMPDALIKLLRK